MEFRISRRTLRRVARWLGGIGAVLAVTIGLYALGLSLTPRTDRGRPILYSPAVRAALTYQVPRDGLAGGSAAGRSGA